MRPSSSWMIEDNVQTYEFVCLLSKHFFFVVISIDLHFKLNYEKGTQRVPLTLSSSIKFFFFQSIISYVFCEYSVVATSLRWKRVAFFFSLSLSLAVIQQPPAFILHLNFLCAHETVYSLQNHIIIPISTCIQSHHLWKNDLQNTNSNANTQNPQMH